METPKNNDKNEMSENKKPIHKKTPSTSSKSNSVKRKARTEIQKKALLDKEKTPSATNKNPTKKPRIANVQTSEASKSRKEIKKNNIDEIIVPPRKAVRGIPSSKKDVFKKGGYSSTQQKKEVKKEEDKNQNKINSQSKSKKDKTVPHINHEQSHTYSIKKLKTNIKDDAKTKSDSKSKISVTKKTSQKKKNVNQKNKEIKKPISKVKKNVSPKKKKSSTKKNKKIKKNTINKNKYIIIILFILLLALIILKLFSNTQFSNNSLTSSLSNDNLNIIEPISSNDINLDYIYVGNDTNDLSSINSSLSLLNEEENNDSSISIVNIEDDKLSGDYVKLTINKGLSAKAISFLLEENGVCSSEAFLNYVVSNNLDTKLRSGTYIIKKNSHIEDIASAIVESDDITIKIYPASTIDQVDQLLASRKLIDKGEFIEACTTICSEKGLEFVEGWFTPAIYKITNKFDVDLLARTMLENTFKILSPYLKDIANSGYSINEIIIIASLIQAETQDVDQMPIISSVIHNRIKKDMPLGIDATTRYELGNWSDEITQEIFDKQTPYNTRRKKGLPPSGICLSSKEAIESAIYPSETDYLYYIHDLDGNLIPALTYEEHLENIEKRDSKI